MAKHLVMPMQSTSIGAIVGDAAIGSFPTAMARRCASSRCKHALLPPGYTHQWCIECLDHHRQATRKGREMRMDESQRKIATVGQMKVPNDPPKSAASSECYFCSIRILIPPGHDSGPLVCESCFKRALAAKEKQALHRMQQPNVPPVPIFRPPPALPQIPTLPPSYTHLNLAGPSSMVIPSPSTASQIDSLYPPVTGRSRIRAIRSRVPEPPLVPPEVWEEPPTRITLSTSFESSRFGRQDFEPIDVECLKLPTEIPPEPLKDSEVPKEPEIQKEPEPTPDTIDNIDDLELEYPDEDLGDLSPVDDEQSKLDVPDAISNHGQNMTEALSVPESSSSSGPQSVFELPNGWDSEVSELTELSDSGESDDERPTAQKTGLKIRIRIPPGFRMPKRRVCAIRTCDRVLEFGYRWKLCEPCRTKFREYTRKRLNIQNPRKDLDAQAHTEIASAATVSDVPMDVDAAQADDVAGEEDAEEDDARICTVRYCHARLPPETECKYRMCYRCRQRSRFNKKRMRAMSLLFETPGEDGVKPNGGLAGHILAMYDRQQARRHKRGYPCDEWWEKSKDKGKEKETDVSAVVSDSSKPPLAEDQAPMDVDAPASLKPETPMLKPITKKPRPVYQDVTMLLYTLRSYLTGFLNALTQHTRMKMKMQAPPAKEPILFAFEGQFSVVAGPDDVPGSNASVMRALAVAQRLEEMLKLTFKVLGTPGLDGDELLVRLRCMQTFALPVGRGERFPLPPEGWKLPPEPAPNFEEKSEQQAQAENLEQQQTEPQQQQMGHQEQQQEQQKEQRPWPPSGIVLRNMAGELEIRIAEDKSDSPLPGLTTMVRFRLVG